MIPKLLHFVWIGKPLPEWAKRNIAEFSRLNPDFEVRLHTDDHDLLPEYRARYRQSPYVVGKADLLRYSILQRHGGWYFDCDYWPLRPVRDIERAYGLTNGALFLTQQHGNKNPKYRVANGVIGSPRDCQAWAEINDAIVRTADPQDRNGLGPALMGPLVEQHPSLFFIAPWPGFYPAGIGEAIRRYRRIQAGEAPHDVLSDVMQYTAGQLPYAMHLWMAGKSDVNEHDLPLGLLLDSDHAPGRLARQPYTGLAAGLLATDQQWRDGTQPFRAIAAGLERLGCQVEVRHPGGTWPLFQRDPKLLVIWNGRKGSYGPTVAAARRAGCRVLVMEHGFFDRRAHTQVDHQGILHWASWTDCFIRKAPARGAERLAAVWPEPLVPFEPRDGYVLVLGQMPGDSQLDDSEIAHPRLVTRAVAEALPKGVTAVCRQHPRKIKVLPDDERYMPQAPHGPLAHAIGGAKFVVTVNSNAGNEALAMGCPVLCFGPSLYGLAGVAPTTSVAGLRTVLREMLAGWQPATAKVRNYLRWLACRQWGQGEFRSGTLLAGFLEEALA